jgi:hypothetical protein
MIANVLDSESEKLLDPVDETRVLESLSKKGELPADLYDVSIDEGLLEFFGKKADSERKLIERTIKYRDNEQHFTQKHDGFGEFPLISLFSKRVECKFAARSFTMLVAGLRNGTYMHVSQAWRLYDDSLMKFAATDTLLEMLEKFADVFGITFTTGGQSGRFFVQSKVESKSIEDSIEFELQNDSGKSRKFSFVVSQFDSGAKDGTRLGSLIYAIDLIKYRHVLTAHGWEMERFDEFHTPMGTWKKNRLGDNPAGL